MYCIKCGVKLADTEKQCPLCATVVFHPDLPRAEGERLYPADKYPAQQQMNRTTVLVVLSAMFLIPLLITLLVDMQISGSVTWSGYVMGALVLSYVAVVLPMWFRKPNPVIFVPVDFAVLGGYLLYISLATEGGWFLSFAFPVVGGLGIIVTTVVTLCRYLRRGRLFVFGGASIALGAFMPLMEFLINLTFDLPRFFAWSLYPLVVLAVLGGLLIYLGTSKSARETMEQKFFI